MGFEQPVDLLQVKYMPSAEELEKIYNCGVMLGTLLAERCDNNEGEN
jgi:hypothetical protein